MTDGISSYMPGKFTCGAGLVAGGAIAAVSGFALLCCSKNKKLAIICTNVGLLAMGGGIKLMNSDDSADGVEQRRQLELLVVQGKTALQPYATSAAQWASNKLPEVVSKSQIFNSTLNFFNVTLQNSTSVA